MLRRYVSLVCGRCHNTSVQKLHTGAIRPTREQKKKRPLAEPLEHEVTPQLESELRLQLDKPRRSVRSQA
jgi:hypothetical protein